MNFTAIFCCYVLLPYFTSLVSPPQEAITCNAFGVTQGTPVVFRTLKERLFTQKIDHYHFTDTRKWLQKYVIFDGHYRGNGRIFLKIGMANDITDQEMQTGSWFEYCKIAEALCIGIEQRGYGKNLPNDDLKLDNLKYLNTEQTLTDLAWFIYNFRHLETGHILPKKLKWVAFGKDKQGSLAVWLRMKYPHLVHSTLTFSAPVLAKVDFNEFFKYIEIDMLNEEPALKTKINEAYVAVNKKFVNRNYEEIGKTFGFCNASLFTDNVPNRERNKDFMYFTFAQIVALFMRYGKDNLKSIKNRATDIMLGRVERYKKTSIMQRFAILIKKTSRTRECIPYDYYLAGKDYINKKTSGIDSLHYPLPDTFGELADLYLSCNEFGRFETFENFFGTKIDLKFYTDFCRVFGERFSNQPGTATELGVRRTNILYGGLEIEVTRVIYVYGDKDPFRKLGIINNYPGHTVTHVLQGVRHCEDLDELEGVPYLNSIKENIKNQLLAWLTFAEANEEKDSKVKPYEITTETENPAISEKTRKLKDKRIMDRIREAIVDANN